MPSRTQILLTMNSFYPSPEKDFSDSSPTRAHLRQMRQASSFMIYTPILPDSPVAEVKKTKEKDNMSSLQELSPIFPSPFLFAPSPPSEKYSIHSNFASQAKNERIINRSRHSKSSRNSFGTANRKKGTGAWTEEEDARLHDLVSTFGPKNWVRVEQGMEGRDKKQCRERWCNHVNPFINDSPFSDEESIFIIDFYIRFGRQWARMSRCAELKNRPDNSIKNHFNTNLRDHYSEICRMHGIPRRLQNDLTPIDARIYERVKGKINAPQLPNVRNSKASRFVITAGDQGGYFPPNERPSSSGSGIISTPWYETKSEPSRPTTQEKFPFAWQYSIGDITSKQEWFSRPSTAQSPCQSRPVSRRTERRDSITSIIQSENLNTKNLFKDEKGRYHLPPPRVPARYRSDDHSNTSTPKVHMQSDIDDDQKDRLWQSLQLLHKPNRYNSISHPFGSHNGQYPSVLRRISGCRRNSAPPWTQMLGDQSANFFHKISRHKHQPVSMLTEANLLALRRATMPQKLSSQPSEPVS